MSNIKLSGHTWDTSGIYDAEQEKTQKQVNADVSELEDTILTGDTERVIKDSDPIELTLANQSIYIGEALSTAGQYRITLKFSDTPTRLSSIKTATGTSASTVVDTLSFVGDSWTVGKSVEYTPSVTGVQYIRIGQNSAYTGGISVSVKVEQINIPKEKTFYTKEQVDNRIKPANRFDINTATFSSELNTSTGEVVAGNHRLVSDYISISGYTSFTFSHQIIVLCYYNSSKEFVSYQQVISAGTLVFPVNVAYMRICIHIDNANSFIVYFDNESTTNTQFGYYSEDGIVGAKVDKEVAVSLYNNKENVENILDGCAISTYTGCAYFNNDIFGKEKKSIACVGTTAIPEVRLYVTTASAINVMGVQAFKLKFFLENASNITTITFYAGTSSGAMDQWSAPVPITDLKNGWNEIIVKSALGRVASWGSYQYFTLSIVGSGAFNLYLTCIEPMRSDKAHIIVVDDHGYQNFLTYAYPKLKALGIPTTWAMRWGLLGELVNTDAGSHLTEAQIETLADDPYSEFSFHSWNGAAASSNTDAQNREIMQKCITALQKYNVMPKHLWRAAWVQNNGGSNVGGIYDMLEGSASWNEQATNVIFPFENIYNIPRMQLHARQNLQDWLATQFGLLKKAHNTIVVYTHSIVANDSSVTDLNMTQAQFDMFADACETGINEGWLEGTTFSHLMTKFWSGTQYNALK